MIFSEEALLGELTKPHAVTIIRHWLRSTAEDDGMGMRNAEFDELSHR